jgi:hypothetical protein
LTDEEMRLIREMDRKLEAFADRIEALETILIEERRFAPMPPVIASRPPVLA